MTLSEFIYNADELNEGKVLFKANVQEFIYKIKMIVAHKKDNEPLADIIDKISKEAGKELCSEKESRIRC